MNWLWFILVAIAGGLVFSLLTLFVMRQLVALVGETSTHASDAFSCAAESLKHAKGRLLNIARKFARQHDAGPMTFIASGIGLILTAGLIWVDYSLLLWTFESALPPINRKWNIAGLEISGYEVAATSVVLMQLLFGFLTMEFWGWTKFMNARLRKMNKSARKRCGIAFATALLSMAIVQAWAAGWRAQAESSVNSQLAVAALSQAHTNFWDGMKAPVMTFVGFITPIATGLSAISIYYFAAGLVAAFLYFLQVPLWGSQVACQATSDLCNAGGKAAIQGVAVLVEPVNQAWVWIAPRYTELRMLEINRVACKYWDGLEVYSEEYIQFVHYKTVGCKLPPDSGLESHELDERSK